MSFQRIIPHEASCMSSSQISLVLRGWFYTMDHDVVPRPCKICDWLLSSSWDHFGLHQGKNIIVIMEFEVPKRHILRRTLSTDMVQWVLRWERQKRCSSRKRQGSMAEKYCYNRFFKNFFVGEEKMKTKKTKEWSSFNFFFFEIVLFGHIF